MNFVYVGLICFGLGFSVIYAGGLFYDMATRSRYRNHGNGVSSSSGNRPERIIHDSSGSSGGVHGPTKTELEKSKSGNA